MSSFTDLARRYIDAWNETDPAARHKAVADLYSEDASYVDPMASATGHQEIAGVIGAVQSQFPGSASGSLARWTVTTTKRASPGSWARRDRRRRSPVSMP